MMEDIIDEVISQLSLREMELLKEGIKMTDEEIEDLRREINSRELEEAIAEAVEIVKRENYVKNKHSR